MTESPQPRRTPSIVRSVAKPLVSYLDHRFADLHAAFDRRFDALEHRVADTGDLQRLLESTQEALQAQTEATRDLASAVEQFARSFVERADDVAGALGALVERAERALGPEVRGSSPAS